MSEEFSLYRDIDRILIDRDEIKTAVERISREISNQYRNTAPVFVCILKGASIFFADLIRHIDLPMTVDFMAISSYGKSTQTSGVVRILKDLDHDIQGEDVIIVEDIVDSGLTLTYIKQALLQRGAKSIRIATLLDKPERRQTDLTVDYKGFTIPNEFVVGYGLDYDERYRNMPDIAVLNSSIYAANE